MGGWADPTTGEVDGRTGLISVLETLPKIRLRQKLRIPIHYKVLVISRRSQLISRRTGTRSPGPVFGRAAESLQLMLPINLLDNGLSHSDF